MASGFSYWYSELLRALKHSAHYVCFWRQFVAEVQFKGGIKGPMVPEISFVYP